MPKLTRAERKQQEADKKLQAQMLSDIKNNTADKDKIFNIAKNPITTEEILSLIPANPTFQHLTDKEKRVIIKAILDRDAKFAGPDENTLLVFEATTTSPSILRALSIRATTDHLREAIALNDHTQQQTKLQCIAAITNPRSLHKITNNPNRVPGAEADEIDLAIAQNRSTHEDDLRVIAGRTQAPAVEQEILQNNAPNAAGAQQIIQLRHAQQLAVQQAAMAAQQAAAQAAQQAAAAQAAAAQAAQQAAAAQQAILLQQQQAAAQQAAAAQAAQQQAAAAQASMQARQNIRKGK